jgi:predicted dehydrogenase
MYFCNRFEFPRWEMEIVGDKGAILMRQSAAVPSSTSITLLTAAGRRTVTLPRATRSWELFWIDDFRSGHASPLSAGYARLVTRICLAARESARKGKTVDLRETKNEH